MDWVHANGAKLDQLLQAQSALSAEFRPEAELKLHEYLALTSRMLDDRDYTAAPGLISINTKDRSKWSPMGYFKKTYVLTPYCECKGNIHPCKDGQVDFTKDRDWWQKTAPWVARRTKLCCASLRPTIGRASALPRPMAVSMWFAVDIFQCVRHICITMKTATVRDLRNHFPRVAAWIEEGESVEITKSGKVFARLLPAVPKIPRKFKMPDITARLHRTFGDSCYDSSDIAQGLALSRGELS